MPKSILSTVLGDYVEIQKSTGDLVFTISKLKRVASTTGLFAFRLVVVSSGKRSASKLIQLLLDVPKTFKQRFDLKVDNSSYIEKDP